MNEWQNNNSGLVHSFLSTMSPEGNLEQIKHYNSCSQITMDWLHAGSWKLQTNILMPVANLDLFTTQLFVVLSVQVCEKLM